MDLEIHDTPAAISAEYGKVEEQRCPAAARLYHRTEPLEIEQLQASTDGTQEHNLTGMSGFEKLPKEIIEQILYLTDPNTFASLLVVHPNWRQAAQSPHLFAHHLSRCPSYSASNNVIAGPLSDGDLPRLRRRFHIEAKRNLFDIYVRPRKTVIKLVSTSASSSAAFPGGEAFHFSISQNGHWVLALSSSRIYVIDVASSTVSVKRELKIQRRALSAAILDDGSVLAVLFTDQEVNLYDLTGIKAKHLRSVPLDNPPSTIALSPTATVLAAAYDKGIEVYSLASDASSTDRRAVKCDAVESLSFSSDGTILLGTTLSFQNPNTVILSAPYLNEGAQGEQDTDLLSQMWTTQILFPNSSHEETHSTLLPNVCDVDSSWMLIYDRLSANFRIIRIEDFERQATRARGPEKKLLPPRPKYLPNTLPAIKERGEAVAVGFASNDIYLYGVPEALKPGPDLDEMDSHSLGSTSRVSTDSRGHNEAATTASSPVAQMDGVDSTSPTSHCRQNSCDKSRSYLDHRRRIGIVDGVAALRWVSSNQDTRRETSCGERLVVVAPGGVNQASPVDAEEAVPADGGRIVVFDFEYGAQGTGRCGVTIELGDNVPELLEERTRNIQADVDIVRRRTIAQRRGGVGDPRRITLIDSSTVTGTGTSMNDHSAVFGARTGSQVHSASLPTTPNTSENARPLHATFSPLEDNFTLEEAQQAFDDPYSHTQPRSQASLFRAATAVAVNRQLNASRHRLPSSGHVEYRRPDGRGELPHESDADNWVPPPPPYTPDPDAPLPEHLQLTLLPRSTEPINRVSSLPQQPMRAQTTLENLTQSALQRTRSTMERPGTWLRARRPSTRRLDSDTEVVSSQYSQSPEQTRPPVEPQQPPQFQQPNYLQHQERRPLVTSLQPPSNFNRSAVSAPTSPVGDPNPWQPLPMTFEHSSMSPQSMRARITSPISPIPESGFVRDRHSSLSPSPSSSLINISPPHEGAQTSYFSPTPVTVSSFSERLNNSNHQSMRRPHRNASSDIDISPTAPSTSSLLRHTDTNSHNISPPNNPVPTIYSSRTAPAANSSTIRHHDTVQSQSSDSSLPDVYLPPAPPSVTVPSFTERLNYPVPLPPCEDPLTSTPPHSGKRQNYPSSPYKFTTPQAPITLQPPAGHQRRVSSPSITPYPASVTSPSRSPAVPNPQPASGTSSLPRVTPPTHLSEPPAPSSPTVEQLSNLQNRYNRPGTLTIRRRPVPNAQDSLGYPVPAVPRAAVGRRSVSTNTFLPLPQSSVGRSNSRGSARSASNPIGRSSSRGSARSPSSSSANVHRHPPPPAPLNRLETIQSMTSMTRPMSRTPPTSPTRSRSRGDVSSVGTAFPKRQRSRAERSAAINLKEAKKRGWGKKSSSAKGKGKGSVWVDGSEWTDETAGSSDAEMKRERGGKCVVM